jgi:Tol biopolymer transport system component
MPDVYVMRADGSSVRRLTRGGGELPTWSPDGRFIAYAGGGGLNVIRPDASLVAHVDTAGVLEPNFVSWTEH